MDLIFRLKRLEELSGYVFILNEESDEELRRTTSLVNIATKLLLNHEVSPKEISTFSVTLPKEAALKIMRFYKEKMDQNILVNLPMNILKQEIILPNLTLHLSDFRLVNDINSIDTIEKSKDTNYQITLEACNPQ